jgi:hypothetical protein
MASTDNLRNPILEGNSCQPLDRLTLKTTNYVYGVEKSNGHDTWALFKACAAGDLPKVKGLLATAPGHSAGSARHCRRKDGLAYRVPIVRISGIG